MILTQHLDRSADRFAYKQIADHLRLAIQDGRLAGGDQLPSEAVLMRHYGVARMTVRAALHILKDEGLTESRWGKGVYVRA